MNEDEHRKRNTSILMMLLVAMAVLNAVAWYFIVMGNTNRSFEYSALADLQSQDIILMRQDLMAYQALIDDTVASSIDDMSDRINRVEQNLWSNRYRTYDDIVYQWELDNRVRGYNEAIRDIRETLNSIQTRLDEIEVKVCSHIHAHVCDELPHECDKTP